MSWLLGCALAGALVASGWLYTDNRSLRRQLDAGASAAAAAKVTEAPGGGGASEGAASSGPARGSSLRRLMGMGGGGSMERPELPAQPQESRADRRKRRQEETAAMFGRLEGESAEEYRERMAPFVKTMLTMPRSRLDEARRAAEDKAGVTEDQRAQLDDAFQDTYKEVLDLTNSALASGELTPYSRNWSGMLNLAGGMGAVLQGTESRISQILSPEQMQIIYDQGFEWGEYLGVAVPWEDLDAPPPPR